jgi:16S rRNA (guanine1207-N2)-methyltransferase
MRSARLTLAIESGAITLPEQGDLLVFRPRGTDDLSALPKGRVRIVQGFRPDHDALVQRGHKVSVRAERPASAALVCLPRSREEGRALIAEAAAHVLPGGPVIVDGQKTDGIDTMYRDIRSRVETSAALSKAHGKIFAVPAGPAFADWAANERRTPEGFVTLPGVFSSDGVDRGSVLLAAALPSKLPAFVVDLGAGWGYLSRAILAREGVRQLELVEAEAAALDCARKNVDDPRARFHWADATVFKPEHAVEAVVSNPPFHVGRAADPSLGEGFIRAAGRMLQPSGALWLVANRHLPYTAVLNQTFRSVEEIAGDGGFRVIRATQPIRQSR